MTMFTSENSDFPAADRAELNSALEVLLSEVHDDIYGQALKSYSDLLNNAWHDGITSEQLLADVMKRRQITA